MFSEQEEHEAKDIAEAVRKQVMPVLQRRLGNSAHSYDTADEVAEAIGRGVRHAFAERGKVAT